MNFQNHPRHKQQKISPSWSFINRPNDYILKVELDFFLRRLLLSKTVESYYTWEIKVNFQTNCLN